MCSTAKNLLEYYLWHEGGRLETRTAEFQFAGITPIRGIAADRDLVPEYPGITESESLSDWDPLFPVDLDACESRMKIIGTSIALHQRHSLTSRKLSNSGSRASVV